jgi:cell division protein FtsB
MYICIVFVFYLNSLFLSLLLLFLLFVFKYLFIFIQNIICSYIMLHENPSGILNFRSNSQVKHLACVHPSLNKNV